MIHHSLGIRLCFFVNDGSSWNLPPVVIVTWLWYRWPIGFDHVPIQNGDNFPWRNSNDQSIKY